MNISLHPSMARFIDEQVASGRFGSPDEVVNGALSALQSQQELSASELMELRAAIAVGITQADRGEMDDWDIGEIRAEGQRLLAEAKTKAV